MYVAETFVHIKKVRGLFWFAVKRSILAEASIGTNVRAVGMMVTLTYITFVS